jgi:hypothetical protein
MRHLFRPHRLRDVGLYLAGFAVLALVALHVYRSPPPVADDQTGGARLVDLARVKTFIQRGELTGQEAQFYSPLPAEPGAGE